MIAFNQLSITTEACMNRRSFGYGNGHEHTGLMKIQNPISFFHQSFF